MAYPRIPIRYHFTGDEVAGLEFVNIARKQVAKLENNMKFTNSKTGKDRPINIRGASIHTTSEFGKRDVYINVPTFGGKKIKRVRRECQCYPCMAIAVIEEIVSETTHPRSYNILICSGNSYVEYEDAHVIDWAQYYVGQFVFVTSKCLADDCGVDITGCLTSKIMSGEYEDATAEQLFIFPVYNTTTMEKSSIIEVVND